MKVEFDATLDDFVDLNMRVRKRSRALRRSNWKMATVFALLMGFMGFTQGAGPLLANVLTGCRDAAIAGVAFILLLSALRPWEKWRIRKFYREQLATDGPIKIEVEISDSGVLVKQHGAQITYGWKSINSVEDSGDAIEIWKAGGPIVVRNRAFNSPGTRIEFLELCRNWAFSSKTS